MVLLRFLRRPLAYARYWGWLAGWHLTYQRDMWRWRRGRGLRPRELPHRHGGKAL